MVKVDFFSGHKNPYTGPVVHPILRRFSKKAEVFLLLLVCIVFYFLVFVDVTTNAATAKTATTATTATSTTTRKAQYVPASTEEYLMTNIDTLFPLQNKDGSDSLFGGEGCAMYENPNLTTQENYDNLHSFRKDLEVYKEAIDNFDSSTTKDLLKKIRYNKNNDDNDQDKQKDLREICKVTRPHPDGIQALFQSKQLSLTKAGYVEPLLTPQRNPKFCDALSKPTFDIDYIIHDYEHMCLNLKPTSQIILIDLGASLEFHSSHDQPAVTLMKKFEKFGMRFDHIYAFEATPTDPSKVYHKLLPQEYFNSYHWINTGVSAGKNDKMNPLYSLITSFHEDDLVIMKLDIDAQEVENPLAQQLLENDNVNKRVDHFYFEHHVRLYEMRAWWGKDIDMASPTVNDSFALMSGLRKKGVASHFWV